MFYLNTPNTFEFGDLLGSSSMIFSSKFLHSNSFLFFIGHFDHLDPILTLLSTRRSTRYSSHCSTILLRKQKKFACLSSQDKSLICLRAIYGKLPDRCRLRQEEVYECENCDGCPFAERCKKTDKNRKVRINRELTAMHQEVVKNLESIQGALLRMNRSIQVESTFGISKK